MAKKKKAEEHVNLERWLVSYADFMTLLFATFVVLYALSQIDIAEYAKLEESIRQAFSGPTIMKGNMSILDNSGQQILNISGQAENDSMVPPLLEYISQKYEQSSMEKIKGELDKALNEGDISGVETEITDRGLVIRLKTTMYFNSASAELNPESFKTLEKIGAEINSKFKNHLVRIEGHTDNLPLQSGIYPSNWELSSARAASVGRYLIDKTKTKPNLISVTGYADTKPIAPNSTLAGRNKNRRVEIVILRNKLAKNEPFGEQTISLQNAQIKVKNPKGNDLSDAAKELMQESQGGEDSIIILDEYNKSQNQSVKEAIKKFEKNTQQERSKLERH
ncbi:MAG: OmpA family protein [Candidatus Gastranaerophilales bacterium]|nr:OmpA family protein [Candidatus Gastranaerophilales bacterium]